jgi:hypothetical protein
MVDNIKVTAQMAKAPKLTNILTRIKNLFSMARAKAWGPRFMTKLTTQLAKSGLGKRVAKKVIAIVLGIFFPGPGWAGAIMSFIWLAADLYWLYTIFDGIITDIQKEDGSVTTPTPEQKDPAYQEEKPEGGQNSFAPRTFGETAARVATTAFPFFGPLAAGFKMGKSFFGKSPAAEKGDYSNVDFSQVKNNIQRAEGTQKTGDPYNVVYGYGKYGSPSKKLTDMSIGEVLNFQSKLRDATEGTIPGQGPNVGTSAVGAYQLLAGNVERISKNLFGKDWRNVKFTPETQDAIAGALFDASKGSNKSLAGQWAYFRNLDKEGGAALRAQAGNSTAAVAPVPGAAGTPTPRLAQPPIREAAAVVPAAAKPAENNSGKAEPAVTVVNNNTVTPSTPQMMPAIHNPELATLLLKHEYCG